MTRTLSTLFVVLGLAAACDPSTGRPPPAVDQPEHADPDGAPAVVVLTPHGDETLRADVVLTAVNDLRTLGLAVDIEGAEIEGFSRDDTLLLSNGGQLLPLESRVIDRRSFRMVVGTTRSVTSTGDTKVASLFLRPTGGDVRLTVRTGGDDLGLLNTRGERLAAAATIANGEEG
jgi:hypothetical protein